VIENNSRGDIGEQCGVAPPLDAFRRKHKNGAEVEEGPNHVEHHGPHHKLHYPPGVAAMQ